MKKYKFNHGLATFLNGLEVLYMMFFTMLPLLILVAIYIEFTIVLYFLLVIIGYIIIGVIICVIIFLFSRLKKKYIILNDKEIIYNKKVINIDNIKYIDFHLGEVGGRMKKGTPYGVNICYKKDMCLEELDYIYIERLPISLLKIILKKNRMIKFSIANLKQKLKSDFIMGIIIGIVLVILGFICEKSGCQ